VDHPRSPRLTAALARHPQHAPAGAHTLDVVRVLGAGDPTFEVARERLATWVTHRNAVVAVEADGRADTLGTTVVLGVGLGPLRAWAGCRVVEVVDEPRCAGYAYATLPGHPARGVERFTVSLAPDGTVTARVQAWSRPAWRVLALAGPLGRAAQRLVARRYLATLVG
jgi:uncharacterized protein (UPF0548 family)